MAQLIKKWTAEIAGGFPIAFSIKDKIFYSINNHGDLFKYYLNSHQVYELSHGICPYCRYISVFDYSGAGPELTMIDVFGNFFIYFVDHRIRKKGKIQGLEKGHITSITPFKGEYLLTVSNPIQRSTKLMITKNTLEVGACIDLVYDYQLDVVDFVINYGKKIAACSYGEKRNDIIIIDLENFSIKEIISGHKCNVEALCFLPDGEILITGGNDYALKFWQTTTGKNIFNYESFGRIKKLEWSEVHKTLFILSSRIPPFDQSSSGLDECRVENYFFSWKFNGSIPKRILLGNLDMHFAQTFKLSLSQDMIITGNHLQIQEQNRNESKLCFWDISN